MPDIFADPADNEIDLGFNDLVGEDKKYKEPDALAKAYAHIERHAREIEAENARLRAEKDVREVVNNNQNPNGGQEPPKPNDPPAPAPNSNSPNSDNVDVRSQIRDEVRALDAERIATSNLDSAVSKLVELYGSEDNAAKKIADRARELGVGVDWLKDSASKSPSAFFATMGIQPDSLGRDRTTPGNELSVRLPDTGSTRNFEYFDKIRKDNPKLYFSAATQREMMAQARKLGSDFYNRT